MKKQAEKMILEKLKEEQKKMIAIVLKRKYLINKMVENQTIEKRALAKLSDLIRMAEGKPTREQLKEQRLQEKSNRIAPSRSLTAKVGH